jgi:probable HAF family extracellular repeat protein
VNDAGQVVGRGYTADYESHAFSWSRSGGLIDLGTTGEYSDASAVGDAGQVVGYSTTGNEEHATMWLKPTAPSAPRAVSALPGDGQATVSFTAPVSDGGTAITYFTVTASPGGHSASGVGSPITVFGLTNGTTYTFRVTASSAVGTGPASESSNAVVPAGPDREHPDTTPPVPRPDVPDVVVTSSTRPPIPGR